MRVRPVSMIAVAILVAAGALAEDSLSVAHQGPVCMSSNCGRSVVNASVTGPSAPKSVRVYFRAGTEGHEYYVEMMLTDGGGYSAVLPSTLSDTPSVSYRVEAVAEDESIISTKPVTIPVTADCQLANLSEPELGFAMNTIVGLTDASQTGAPRGFSCAGVVKVVGVDQTMAPNSACEEVRLAQSDPCFSPEGEPQVANAGTGAAKRGGIGLGAAAVIGGAVVGGAVIIENNEDENREPVSRARP